MITPDQQFFLKVPEELDLQEDVLNTLKLEEGFLSDNDKKELQTLAISLRTSPVNSQEIVITQEQEFLNAVNSFDQITNPKTGETQTSELLTQHKHLFARELLRTFSLLKNAEIPPYGYHAIDWSEINQGSHIFEHAKALVARTLVGKELLKKVMEARKSASTQESVKNLNLPQSEECLRLTHILLAPIVGDIDNYDDLERHILGLQTIYDDEAAFQQLLEDEILISLFHDIEEQRKGRATHEEDAKLFLYNLIESNPAWKKRLSQKVFMGYDENNNEIYGTRMDRILLGIDGSKVSTQIPPVDVDEINVEESGKVKYTVPAAVANSTWGKLLRGATEVSDWERVTHDSYSDKTPLDLLIDLQKDPENQEIKSRLFESLKHHPYFLLIGESLVQDKEKIPGSNLQVIYKNNLINFLTGGYGFLKFFVQGKARLYDNWYKEVGNETFQERYVVGDDVAVKAVHDLINHIRSNPNEAIRLAYLAGIIVEGDAEGALSFDDALSMSTDDLANHWNRGSLNSEYSRYWREQAENLKAAAVAHG